MGHGHREDRRTRRLQANPRYRWICHGSKKQQADAYPVAKPGPDEVLVNIKYSGVCHTDLHAVNGDWPLPTKLPLVGGHEGAGVVVAKGELVTDIEIGDHAGIKACHSSIPWLPYRCC